MGQGLGQSATIIDFPWPLGAVEGGRERRMEGVGGQEQQRNYWYGGNWGESVARQRRLSPNKHFFKNAVKTTVTREDSFY